MCHYITAVLPRTAHIEKVRAIMKAHHRQLEELANRSIESQLLSGEAYFLTAARRCDCGTMLGFAARRGAPEPFDIEGAVEKLKRKGWGKAKIDRWIEERLKAEPDANNECAENWGVNTDWDALLAAVSHSQSTPRLGLLLHYYSGPLSGRIALKGRERVALGDDRLQALGCMQEDTLYVFECKP